MVRWWAGGRHATDPHPPTLSAAEWFTKANDQGNTDAAGSLGMLYHYGWGVSRDWQRAIDLYKSAMDRADLTTATFNLGILYMEADRPWQSWATSRKYLNKAKSQGNAGVPGPLGQIRHTFPHLGQRVVLVALNTEALNGMTRACPRRPHVLTNVPLPVPGRTGKAIDAYFGARGPGGGHSLMSARYVVQVSVQYLLAAMTWAPTHALPRTTPARRAGEDDFQSQGEFNRLCGLSYWRRRAGGRGDTRSHQPRPLSNHSPKDVQPRTSRLKPLCWKLRGGRKHARTHARATRKRAESP